MRNKRLLFLLCAILALMSACAALAANYRTLSVGDSGTDVTKLKKAMYYLGYFTNLNVSDQYNQLMSDRVKQLQKNNGLEETGIATPELQELIYSGNCVPTANAPKPTSTPVPPVVPTGEPDIPELTEESFLPAGSEPYVFTDKDDGRWIYISDSLHIDIRRYTVPSEKNTWFEIDILCSPGSPLSVALNYSKTGKSVIGTKPKKLADAAGFVLAFSDDHFGDRVKKSSPGVIIRDQKIWYTKTYKNDRKLFPNLEVMAVFEDGSMKTFKSSEHTAKEYLEMGAVHTFAFGPILVQNGELTANMLDDNYYRYHEPRMALGMIEPYHYYLIAANGRVSNKYKGVYLQWMAQKMVDAGVQEALNLDGGGTMCVLFMGEKLTTTGSDERLLYSMIGFGQR